MQQSFHYGHHLLSSTLFEPPLHPIKINFFLDGNKDELKDAFLLNHSIRLHHCIIIKKQVRNQFLLNGFQTCFSVTDVEIEEQKWAFRTPFFIIRSKRMCLNEYLTIMFVQNKVEFGKHCTWKSFSYL